MNEKDVRHSIKSRQTRNRKKDIDSMSECYVDYSNRLKKIATSIFEWENLPESMNARFLEETLYQRGEAGLIWHKEYGYINTMVTTNGYLNIYGLPSKLNCMTYGHVFTVERNLYTGINTEESKENECVLVMNTWDRVPTMITLDIFARRLANVERTIDVNINAQRTPILVLGDEKSKLTLENLYQQYEGGAPVIYGNKDNYDPNSVRVLSTQAPYLARDLTDYKKEIWNEALTFLGINNLDVEKKERLVTGEVSSNNEVINMNLESFLAPRKKACEEFNKLFGTNINVKVRSDLHNMIKEFESTISDYNKGLDDEDEAEEEIINE